MVDLSSPVTIQSVDLLCAGERYFVRATSTDGAVGMAVANERVRYLYPILQQLVAPYFLGKDARDLDALVDGVYVYRSNYKLAGLALWCCVGWVEFALLDLLGRVADKPVAALLGGVRRREIPVYLSSMRRDTTPEAEVEILEQRLAETGARAVKLKIGGRMSRNADASPGRSERLVKLARERFGSAVTLYVDANGSYDAPTAIAVGRMLADYGVAFFEEPCPFDEWEETRRVADALELAVAGGEQETSFCRFAWAIRNRAVDVVQPDLNYNGGFTRTLRVARLAHQNGLPTTPHSARLGADPIYMLHYAACAPNPGAFQEYNAAPQPPQTWFSPSLQVRNGVLVLPDGPGFGLSFDPVLVEKAVPL
ncbi:MAG: mandelate racemase/muconate lactonizing enzyme family protein [Armatimonadota bacterium]|nr:mandelate racemase/muconate lactonizing enzyme family protein [Armatimonadota bacterium]